jgi:hypothetical protein
VVGVQHREEANVENENIMAQMTHKIVGGSTEGNAL